MKPYLDLRLILAPSACVAIAIAACGGTAIVDPAGTGGAAATTTSTSARSIYNGNYDWRWVAAEWLRDGLPYSPYYSTSTGTY